MLIAENGMYCGCIDGWMYGWMDARMECSLIEVCVCLLCEEDSQPEPIAKYNAFFFIIIFPLAVSSPNNVYSLISRTTNCLLYSNISQIWLLYKTWGYHNKFESMKSLGGTCMYWYVKMPPCGCVEHGLENTCITFYVLKHIAHLATLFWFSTGSRRALAVPAFVEIPFRVKIDDFLSPVTLKFDRWSWKIMWRILLQALCIIS